jgi:hypothetical protein
MPELDVAEAELADDFLQHLVAVFVAARVPAGGERNHGRGSDFIRR